MIFWMKELEKITVKNYPDTETVVLYRNPIKLAIRNWIADDNDRNIIILSYGLVKIDRKLLINSHLF